MALNILYVEAGEQVRQAYISRFNSVRQRVVDLLIVEQGGKKHYTAITRLSALLRGVTSTHDGDFYCRNCLNSFCSKEVHDLHVKVCVDHEFCRVKMPEEGENILTYQGGSKALRVPFVSGGNFGTH